MKIKPVRIISLLALWAGLHQAAAQGTAFTYQGQLYHGGSPASGTFNLTFSLFPIGSGGLLPVAGPVTNNAVFVTNGLFTVTIDFGASAWNGQTNWLQIGVATNGINTFTTLTPRQQLTPAPYAIYSSSAGTAASATTATTATTANNVPAGSITEADIAGGQVVKSLNNLQDAVTLAAGTNVTITPSGNTLTIASTGGGGGGGGWLLTGNSGTTPGADFLGTLDNEPLELWVNGALAWSLAPGPNYPNVAGGSQNNLPAGADGTTIAGGVANTVGSDQFDAVGGGFRNTATNGYSTVSGGEYNTANRGGVVVGGYNNTALGQLGVVGGGAQNAASGAGSFVGGGGYDGTNVQGNAASGAASTVGGGVYDFANGAYSAVLGGYNNNASGTYSSVPGGLFNVASGFSSFAAGHQAQAQHTGSFVWADATGGAFVSTADDQFSVRAEGGVRFVTGGSGLTGMTLDGFEVLTTASGGGGGGGGGSTNAWLLTGNTGANPANGYFLGTIDTNGLELHVDGARGLRLDYAQYFDIDEDNYQSINVNGGWGGNTVLNGSIGATIAGGGEFIYDQGNGPENLPNSVTGNFGSVGGGENNSAGTYATVPGGYNNSAKGQGSFAAGNNATANQNNSFVWGDGSRAAVSQGSNSFAVLATGGIDFFTAANTPNLWVGDVGDSGGEVGINTSTPRQALDVNGGWVEVQGNGAQAAIGGLGTSAVDIGSFNSSVTSVAFVNLTTFNPMNVQCCSITIQGGCDLAEPFQVSSQENDIPEGAVMVIDESNPGRLKLSQSAYDTHVAGVISGANGINPGIQMQQQGLLEGGKNVSLTGRVYVQADASNGAIRPGDLLTTSASPGRAMKVTDHAKAQGAILGKAMTGLEHSQGMVLVLVTLQ